MKNDDIYQENPTGHYSLYDVKYDLNKIFMLVHGKAIRNVPVKDLTWNLEYSKVVNEQGEKVCGSCQKGPKGWHEERVSNSNLEIPVIVTRYRNKLLIVDGVHRLEKAVNAGASEIPTKELSKEEMNSAKVR